MTAKAEFTIHQMRVFSLVARHGSISRAAGILTLPQPAISRLIGRIEKTAGVTLFARTGSGVSLTEAGETFLAHSANVLHYHDLAYANLQEIRGKLVGEVRLAALDSVSEYLFVPLIKRFQASHPNAAIRTIAAASSSIPSMLDNGTIEIGVIADTHPQPAGAVEALCREELHLVGRNDAPEMGRASIPLEQAARLPLILTAMPGGFRSIIDAACAERGLVPNVRTEIDANGPLLDLIVAGEGYSILPFSIVARKQRTLGLAGTKVVSPTISRRLSMIVARGRPITPACREAARMIKRIIAEQASIARWSLIDDG